MPEIGIDLETRGVVDLKRSGAHRYAADASTDVLIVAFAVDDGPIETWIASSGVPCPDAIKRAAEGWTFHAFNAQFERAIWHHILTPRYGWPEPRLEQWRCTQAVALANALPGSLEGAAEALKLPHRKDPNGHAAMLRLSRPRKARKGEDPAIVYWGGRDGDLELARRYCAGDVEQERAVRRRVRPLIPEEQKLWALDAEINSRGFHVDVALARAAQEIVRLERAAINAEISALTGGKITTANQRDRILAFVQERGHAMKTLGKRNVAGVLARGDPDAETRCLLELRRDGGLASANKFGSLFAGIDADDRARGTLKFHAASTGRWSGNRIQPHNLRRPLTKDLDAAVDAVLSGDIDRVRALGAPLSIVGDVSRSMIDAPPGRLLVCGDFSTLESRILAWLAGEGWKLANFREFDRTGDPRFDNYLVGAAKVLKRPVAPDDDASRHLGKILISVSDSAAGSARGGNSIPASTPMPRL
jgi:DNA polymerase